tara:strand:- start:2360 stop:3358 length:999 start_codon:yes stop_codon:yes gene_type:complete
MFKNKILLITGGTGSFGSTVLEALSNRFKEIRVFSRDEKKQHDLRYRLNKKNIRFIVGDIRDYDSIFIALNGVDYVFHAAALKQVPSCEFQPMEAVKTNILGVNNLILASDLNNVRKVIVLSTDKAVQPVNAMGMTKAISEKLIISNSRFKKKSKTIFCCTRYGNVVASRGSVIPLFIKQIKNKQPITITDPNMTRFLMTLGDSVNLVINALIKGKSGEIFVQKAPSAKVITIANVLNKMLNGKSKINLIGIRHGEKMHETLVSSDEMARAKIDKNFFCIKPDMRSLNYNNYYFKGSSKILNEFNSQNSKILNSKELEKYFKNIKLLNHIYD